MQFGISSGKFGRVRRSPGPEPAPFAAAAAFGSDASASRAIALCYEGSPRSAKGFGVGPAKLQIAVKLACVGHFDKHRNVRMKAKQVIDALGALAQETRLDIYRLLVQR